MSKKYRCALFLTTGMLLLSACQNPFMNGQNVEELLRAPQVNAVQSAVQSALNSYLGSTCQLKYPRGGDEMSPLIFADLDGDGEKEAAVLYTTEAKGKNVHIAVLENRGAAWEVTQEVQGLSTEVAQMQVTTLTTGLQLLVGYGNATLADKYLAVYDYHGDTMTSLYEQSYTDFLAADFEGKGVSDLVVVPPATQPGALTLALLHGQDGALQNVQTLSLDERFEESSTLKLTKSGGKSGLVIDGKLSASSFASQLLQMKNGRFFVWHSDDEIETDIPTSSLRYLSVLGSYDFGSFGTVEIPTDVTAATTLTSARRFYFVSWRDYLASSSPRYGVYDTTYGYFVRLPEEWKNTAFIADGGQSTDWQIKDKKTNQTLVTVRVANRGAAGGTYVNAGTVGEKSILLSIGSNCTGVEASIVRNGVKVME